MRGRSRGNYERIIMLAHQVEVMAREKRLKPIAKYLEPAKPAKKGDPAQVLAMLKRMKKRQDAKGD